MGFLRNSMLFMSIITSLVVETSDITAKQGDTVVLECDSTSSAEIGRYEWQLNGYTLTETKNTLVLPRLTIADSGIYACIQNANVHSQFNIIVSSAESSIILRPTVSYQQATSGENVTISCISSGNVSLVEWTRCNSEWDDYEHQSPISNPKSIIHLSGHISYLTLVNVNQADSGCYQCRLALGSRNHANVYVSVIDRSVFESDLFNGISLGVFLLLTGSLSAFIVRQSMKTKVTKQKKRRRLALSVASSHSSNQVSDLFNFDPLNFV